jgi:hypothetical protein
MKEFRTPKSLSKQLVSVLGLSVFVCWFALAVWHRRSNEFVGDPVKLKSAALWVSVLFLIPLALQSWCIWSLRIAKGRVYATFVMHALFFNSFVLIAWLVYLLGRVLSYTTYGRLALVLAGVAVVFVGLCVRQLHRLLGPENQIDQQLISTISAYRLHAVCFFLSAFLSVAYLLAFAVAFDDRSEHGKALFYAKEAYHPDTGVSDHREAAQAKFFFARGVGSLDLPHNSAHGDALPDPAELWHGPPDEECDPVSGSPSRERCNSLALSAIARFIDSTSATERLRFTIMSHADSGTESLNWELTRMRAAETHRQLASWLGQKRSWDENKRTSAVESGESPTGLRMFNNIDFVELSVGSQNLFLGSPPVSPVRRPNRELWRLVEVKMEVVNGESEFAAGSTSGGRKTLLDYVYFLIYTITTTGYGDMIPISAFVKFVTSLANMFEILFLVIFTNVIISLSQETRHR